MCVCVCVCVQFNAKHVGQSLLGMFFDVCMLSCFSRVRLFATPWTVAHQAPLSMRFSRPKYWGGLPFSPPGDLPNPGIKPESPMAPALQVDSLPLSHQGSPCCLICYYKSFLSIYQDTKVNVWWFYLQLYMLHITLFWKSIF